MVQAHGQILLRAMPPATPEMNVTPVRVDAPAKVAIAMDATIAATAIAHAKVVVAMTEAHGTTVVAAIVVAHDVAKAVMVTATKNVTLAPMDSAPRRRAMALVIPTGVTPVRRVKIHPAKKRRAKKRLGKSNGVQSPVQRQRMHRRTVMTHNV